MIKLAIVSPCYNEEDVLGISAEKLKRLFADLIGKGKISPDSFVLLVDDGSSDATWKIITELHAEYPWIKGISLAHNAGHQNAIMAGMMEAREHCDALVTIDADLQDELACIEQMVDAYGEGYDVVYGVKVERKADSFLKRKTAEAYYKLMEKMGVETVYNHADFRFLSRRVVDALSEYPESELYLRALIKKIGFPSTTVEDHLSVREAGHSKYNLRRMLNLAINGITSFTDKPLYLIIYLGVAFVFVSFLVLLDIIISAVTGHIIQGWTSLILSVWFVGGIILIALGIIGVYLGKVFVESKRRPRYNIKDRIN